MLGMNRRMAASVSNLVRLPMDFPAGIRVLVVDDDPTCLKTIERLLCRCRYNVTTCPRADTALSMVREKKGGFDLIMSDVHMPDMDGLKLLELVGLETDLPVIMISADDGMDVVMKGVTNGAVDYIVKPVRIEAVKIMWQHVVRKYQRNEKVFEHVERAEGKKPEENGDGASSAENDGSWRNGKRKKDENNEEEEEDDEKPENSSTVKKPRVIWSPELHRQFISAVGRLGADKAVPKKILEIMEVPGITRENVASHLQKYRLYLKKNMPMSPDKVDAQMSGATSATYAPINSVGRFGLQGLHISGQHVLQNQMNLQSGATQTTITGTSLALLDRMNRFNFTVQPSNTSRFVTGQQLFNNRQVNTITRAPTNMESRQSQQVLQPYTNLGLQARQGVSGMMIPFPVSTSSAFNLTTGNVYPRNSIQQQFQQQNNFTADMPTRGQLMNGVAGEVDQMLLSNTSQQITTPISNVRGTSLPETLLTSSYGFSSTSQNLHPCVGDNYTTTSMATQDISPTGMLGETISPRSNIGLLDDVIGLKREDNVAPNCWNDSRNTGIVNGDVMPIGTETNDCNKITRMVQCSNSVTAESSAALTSNDVPELSTNVIPNEFLQQEGIGVIDSDFNYESFSIDDILNYTSGLLQM